MQRGHGGRASTGPIQLVSATCGAVRSMAQDMAAKGKGTGYRYVDPRRRFRPHLPVRLPPASSAKASAVTPLCCSCVYGACLWRRDERPTGKGLLVGRRLHHLSAAHFGHQLLYSTMLKWRQRELAVLLYQLLLFTLNPS